ncbi:hypothetical protein ACFL1N_14635 [Thermodesulfobacteriota bacterium]
MKIQFNNQKDKNKLTKMSRDILKKYYKVMNDNELEGVLGFIHSCSPVQIPTRQVLGQLMSTYKLKNELLQTNYVGADNGYLFVKMKQKTTKLKGPEFKDNITDSIVAMRQDEGTWKIWSMMPLQTDFL